MQQTPLSATRWMRGEFILEPRKETFFFGGARLLDLSSMLSSCLREASLLPPPPAPGVAGPSDPALRLARLLPLTDRVGFQQLACDCDDGRVLLLSGFNETCKARSWAAYLELVMHDTV